LVQASKDPERINYKRLSTSVLTMDFFDRLEEHGRGATTTTTTPIIIIIIIITIITIIIIWIYHFNQTTSERT
jgi:hypothetical protein